MRCMRDDPHNNGRCPVADSDLHLIPPNDLIVKIYNQATGSARQINTETAGRSKAHLYLRPVEIEALMRIHGIPDQRRSEVLNRIFTLQDIANDLRPSRSRPRKKR